jgi:hypothetical protein
VRRPSFDFHCIPAIPEAFHGRFDCHISVNHQSVEFGIRTIRRKELFVMYDVMIHCLHTGRLVPTGVKTDEVSFEKLPEVPATLNVCPACGSSHVWSRKSAMLKREKAA